MTDLQRASRVLSGRYCLLEQVGGGGMARVYRARDIETDRFVAVKVLREPYSEDPSAIERFEGEARAALSLHHPHIVEVLDLGMDEGRPFLVMELVAGGDLRERLRQFGKLSLPTALRVASQIAAALQAAHEVGIVHRDVKPSNILLESTPDASVFAKLADFGIARAVGAARRTRTGEVMGSVHYVSPEQLRGQPGTPQSDIYGLGCVLFEMLVGRPPFDADTEIAVAMHHLQRLPPRPSALRSGIPDSVDEIVLTCLRKAPEQRYASADALRAALAAAVGLAEQRTEAFTATPVAATTTSLAAHSTPPTNAGSALRQLGRRRVVGGLGALALTGVVAVGALGAGARGSNAAETQQPMPTLPSISMWTSGQSTTDGSDAPPTPTAVPPTATPVPPTATPAPTKTPVPAPAAPPPAPTVRKDPPAGHDRGNPPAAKPEPDRPAAKDNPGRAGDGKPGDKPKPGIKSPRDFARGLWKWRDRD